VTICQMRAQLRLMVTSPIPGRCYLCRVHRDQIQLRFVEGGGKPPITRALPHLLLAAIEALTLPHSSH
jgi:hypothetical protein